MRDSSGHVDGRSRAGGAALTVDVETDVAVEHEEDLVLAGMNVTGAG